MKIALAQLNYRIADLELNTNKMLQAIRDARKNDTDLIIFSELSLSGYPPQDFLEQKDFIGQVERKIEEIAAECKKITAIIGAPIINHQKHGKKLFNAALVLEDGKVRFTQAKTHLPNYDVFDEYRYFEHNTKFEVFELKGQRIAITICEDLWDFQPVENSFARDTLYTVSPLAELAKHKPDFVVNISASPFSYNHDHNRKNILIHNAKEFQLPIFYVNQIGANTELIFDGGSLVLNNKGEILHQLPFFTEAVHYFDTEDFGSKPYEQKKEANYIARIHDALILGVRDYFQKSGFQKAVLGLSGGIDSALTLAIAAKALGSANVSVMLLPSRYSSDHSVKDALDMAKKLNIKYHIVSIEDSFKSIEKSLKPVFEDLPPDVTEENIQARLRGLFLMAYSNKFGSILLNTSNKSEAAVGYGTLYGDMNGGLAVIGDVYKSDVFKLARFINRNEEIIPENTISKPPSAELRPDQKDSDSLPDYEVLDRILFRYIEQKESASDIIAAGFDEAIVNKTIRLVNRNEYKRFQTAPVLRVSSKAFGFGRRIPIVARH